MKKQCLCFDCRKVIGEEPKEIGVLFEGSSFTLRSEDIHSICWACAKAQFLADLARIGKFSVRSQGEDIWVDWEYYSYHHDQEDDRYRVLNRVLLTLGVFSYSPARNWEIETTGPINLNPRTTALAVLYFKRKEDVIAFALANRGKTLYEWWIKQIGEVLSKSELMRK